MEVQQRDESVSVETMCVYQYQIVLCLQVSEEDAFRTTANHFDGG